MSGAADVVLDRPNRRGRKRSRGGRTRRQGWSGATLALTSLCALVVAALAHVGLGAKYVPPRVALDALFNFDPTNWDHIIVIKLRLPRLLIAMAVGACLAVAGATIQAVTRNPLAGPGILGMNAGAALAVVMTTTFIGGAALGPAMPWISAGGALAVFAVVIGLSSAGRSGPTPFKVTLAGVAVSAFAGAITSSILLFDENTLEQVRLWLAGSLSGRPIEVFLYALIPMVIGVLIAIASTPRLNALALGEQAATGLGVSVKRTRIVTIIAVGLLAGSAVAVVGPIGFIGLVVPHIVKIFVPNENRLIVPLSGVVGAVTLVLADLAGRMIVAPMELATGIMTALLGAPIFVLLVRTRL